MVGEASMVAVARLEESEAVTVEMAATEVTEEEWAMAAVTESGKTVRLLSHQTWREALKAAAHPRIGWASVKRKQN